MQSRGPTQAEFEALLADLIQKLKLDEEFIAIYEDKLSLRDITFVDVKEYFAEAGYAAELNNIDFSRVLLKLYFNWLVFKEFSFVNCKLGYSDFQQCVLTDCELIGGGSPKFSNCLVLIENESDTSKNLIDFIKRQENNSTLVVNKTQHKPIVAVVYEPRHGTWHTDITIKILRERGLEVVTIECEKAFDDSGNAVHPLLSRIDLIDGLFLPGGDDVITDKANYSTREKLETLFMDLSMKHKIPTLGICRGHQFVGHYFGAEIKNIPFDHHDKEILVRGRHQSSRLFQLAQRKHTTQKNGTHDIKKLNGQGSLITK